VLYIDLLNYIAHASEYMEDLLFELWRERYIKITIYQRTTKKRFMLEQAGALLVRLSTGILEVTGSNVHECVFCIL